MNKVLRSFITKIISLIGGYIAWLSAARAFSGSSFRESIDSSIYSFLYNWMNLDLVIAVVLFAVCAALLFISVWKSKEKIIPVWRKADLSLIAVITWLGPLLCVYFAARYMHYAGWLLLASVISYAFVIALLSEFAARLRDKQWNLLWPKFFKRYPLRRPIGLLIAILLAGNIFYMCFYYAILSFGNVFTMVSEMNIPALLFSAFTLCAITFFCSFLLSISDEYERANDEKIRAERFKSELIANVSHDIRTPLTSIINYVDLLKALPIKQDNFLKYVNVLERKSDRLKTLINDLMEASKASTRNVSVNIQDVDLSEIIGQVAGEFEEQLIERGLTLILRQIDQPVIVRADSNHLWRALENLFGNAFKYALPGTRVFAEINLQDSNVIFSLKNTSQNPIDLPADALTEQFIRGDRARQTDGSGLGLYIAKSLIELMGGRFTIRATGDLFEAEIMFC